MAKKKHGLKRKALEAQLADSEQRRTLAEADRDEQSDRALHAEYEALALSEKSDAFARTILRAAGTNGNGDLATVRKLCRSWLDGA